MALRDFVRVRDGRFFEGDRPYAFVGANLWHGAGLASRGPGGDRARLDRELDRLQRLGVRVLRVLAGSEGPASEPWRIAPPLQRAPGVYDEAQLDGLDHLLAAMGARGLRAIVCLSNFWHWSGGLAQYLSWAGEGPIPYPPPAAGGSYHAYQTYTARFYSHARAVELYERHLAFIVGRANAITGRPYREDPTILAWELANEPRGMANADAMRRWIDRSAALIKSLDGEHLVTTGSEGDAVASAYHGLDFVKDHASPHVDFATFHVWPQNWFWYDPAGGERAYRRAESIARGYVARHLARAAGVLRKPAVLEEFGLARDGGGFDAAAGTAARDRFYEAMLGALARDFESGGAGQGAAFWAWSGEARPRRPAGGFWRPGDPVAGDPPHEPQGWYGVCDADASTLAAIRRAAARLEGAPVSGTVDNPPPT